MLGGVLLLDVALIFKNRSANLDRLREYGFKEDDGRYIFVEELDELGFSFSITVSDDSDIDVKVYDDLGEEYVPIKLDMPTGDFVARVKLDVEDRLRKISDACFDNNVFKFKQSQRLLEYVRINYSVYPEFLWEKFDNNAVLRRKDTQKWFVLICRISRQKLGIDCDKDVEIIDIRGVPEEIEGLVDGIRYFPGYHMNKKHWYTICLDESVSDEELFGRIDKSFELAKK